jgi:hypothetical protein
MTPDPSEFLTVDEHRMVKMVDTPLPETADGSGYTTEENRQWLYRVDKHYALVAKAGNLGWYTAVYDTSKDGSLELDGFLCENANAQTAHRRAIVELGV